MGGETFLDRHYISVCGMPQKDDKISLSKSVFYNGDIYLDVRYLDVSKRFNTK